MQILIELRTALKKQRKQIATNLESKEDPSISCTISCDEESVKGALDQQLDQENSTSYSETNDGQLSESQKSDEIEKAIKIKREGKLRSLSGRVVSCQGKNVKINIPLTTPTRTLSAITCLLREDLGNQSKKFCTEGNKLSVNKTKIHHAEKMIRGAFIELYKGLGYLKTYRHLNILAFAKILKKFDKATGKQVLPIYLKVVESSYFNSSDKEIKLADEVEELFVRNFAEEDRRKAMKYLKPRLRKESHAVTFFIVTNSQVKCGMRGHLGLACNAVGYVDRQVWGINHLCNYPVWQRLKACTLSSPELGPFQEDAPSWCRDPFEPEGLLSSISAIMSCTIGVHYGHVLIHFKEHSERLKHWISMGLGLLIVAIILHFTDAIPIKQLYSFSYVCFTAGAAGIVFSGFYILIDIFGYRTPFLFLEWIGMNAMLVFVMAAQGIFAGFVNGWYYGDQDKTLVNWIQEHVFNDVWHSERLGTLLYVIFAEITFWGVVSGILHKLGIYWKL